MERIARVFLPRSAPTHIAEFIAVVFLWQASVGVFFLSIVQQYLPVQLDASPAFPGYAMAIYGGVRFLWQTPAGWIADRIGRRLTMVIGMAIGIPTLCLMLQVPEPHAFLGLSAVLGLSAATMWPAFMAHLGETLPQNRRGSVMSAMNAAGMVGLGLGTVVGVVLMDFISYRAAFAACLGFNGLALALAARKCSFRLTPAVCAPRLATARGGRTLTPAVVSLAAIVLFLSLGTTIHTPVVGRYVTEVLDTKLYVMALFLIPSATVAAITLLKFGHMADRLGRHVPLIAGLFLAALSLFLLTLTRNPLLAVNLAVLAGLAYAVSLPAWSAAALDATDIGSRGLLLGAMTAIQGLGGALGQALGGRVSEMYGPLAPFKFGAILLIVALLLTIWHLQITRRQRHMSKALLPLTVRIER